MIPQDLSCILPESFTGNGYTCEITIAETTTADARHCRDVARFEKLCMECPCYGRRWCCPPLETDMLERPDSYEHLTLVGARIIPDAAGRPIGDASTLIANCRQHIEPTMLKMEAKTGGLAALFTGQCTHCGNMKCSRINGKPCRHPELVRPSLEALGYDVGALAADFLNQKLQWSADGKIPEYLVIVAGLFH